MEAGGDPFELDVAQLMAPLPRAAQFCDGSTYLIHAELPGIKKEDIHVHVDGPVVSISAERKQRSAQSTSQAPADGTSPDGSEPQDPGTLLSEFRYGTWSRSFRFPSGIDREGLNAHYRDGLLTVTAPKAQTMTSVSVKVEG